MHGETDQPTYLSTELQHPTLWLKRDAEEHDRARQCFPGIVPTFYGRKIPQKQRKKSLVAK